MIQYNAYISFKLLAVKAKQSNNNFWVYYAQKYMKQRRTLNLMIEKPKQGNSRQKCIISYNLSAWVTVNPDEFKLLFWANNPSNPYIPSVNPIKILLLPVSLMHSLPWSVYSPQPNFNRPLSYTTNLFQFLLYSLPLPVSVWVEGKHVTLLITLT